MTHIFDLMELHGYYGIIGVTSEATPDGYPPLVETRYDVIVEPEFSEAQARRMLAILEDNPDIEPDDLYRLAEAA